MRKAMKESDVLTIQGCALGEVIAGESAKDSNDISLMYSTTGGDSGWSDSLRAAAISIPYEHYVVDTLRKKRS